MTGKIRSFGWCCFCCLGYVKILLYLKKLYFGIWSLATGVENLPLKGDVVLYNSSCAKTENQTREEAMLNERDNRRAPNFQGCLVIIWYAQNKIGDFQLHIFFAHFLGPTSAHAGPLLTILAQSPPPGARHPWKSVFLFWITKTPSLRNKVSENISWRRSVPP